MSRLNLIVESLLKDIIEAQHAANCHAASLARQYGKRGRACGFPLPSAQIGSLEFDLKYAVTGTSGVEEKQVAGHPIALRHTDTVPTTPGACHLLFVSRSEAGRLDRILAGVAGLPVLTVSDIPGFAASGGVFEFRNRDGRLAFVINNTRARASGIQVSASLLALALEVL